MIFNNKNIAVSLTMIVLVGAISIISVKERGSDISKKCSIPAPEVYDIRGKAEVAESERALDVMAKLKEFIPLDFEDSHCVKRVKLPEDGILRCYLVKDIEIEQMYKVCFAPKGALFSVDFQE